MKTLIAATDFSSVSLSALNYAADMAEAINANLELLHVMHVPVVDISDTITQLEEENYKRRVHELQILKQRLERRTNGRIQVTTTILEGNTKTVIENISENQDVLAIILGLQKEEDITRFFFGSIGIYAAKHAHIPVMLVPKMAKFAPVTTIAFPTDLLIENAANLVKVLRKWLTLFNARLEIVNINADSHYEPEQETLFANLKKSIHRQNVHFNYVVNDSLVDGIATYVKMNRPSMLVLMYHKEKLLHRIAFRSDFNRIIKETTVPLLVVPDRIGSARIPFVLHADE